MHHVINDQITSST